MTPSPIVELWIEKDRFPIEMGDEGGIDLAAVDRLQNRDHGLWRFKAAQVQMDGVGRSPYPGFLLRSNTSHDDAPLMFIINRYHNA